MTNTTKTPQLRRSYQKPALRAFGLLASVTRSVAGNSQKNDMQTGPEKTS